MKWYSKLAVTGLSVAAIRMLAKESKKEREEKEQKKAEEQKRKNTPCVFDNQLPQTVFNKIVVNSIKKIKRIHSYEIQGPVVFVTVLSQSGATKWNFEIDFNDYGRITGKTWIYSENADSNIPDTLSSIIVSYICDYIDHTKVFESEETRNQQNHEPDIKKDDTKDIVKTKTEESVENLRRETKEYDSTQSHKKSLLLVFIIFITILVLIGCMFCHSLTPISYSVSSLQSMTYIEATEKLQKVGFKNIYAKEISDLPLERENEENIISDVKLEHIDSFNEHTLYPSFMEIELVYHTVKLYSPPILSKDVKGMSYFDVIAKFEEVGFTNITTNIEYDVITGWITEPGEVKSITINSDTEFDCNEYRLDAEIVITYHDLKKNAPK